MAALEALNSGMAGAVALTVVHEVARRQIADAPRMDLLGQRAIARLCDVAFSDHPSKSDLRELSLVGDLTANSLYYSLVGVGCSETAITRGGVLGAIAGLGAITLPGPLGLGSMPSNRTNATRAMTIAWYTVGGLVAGSIYRLLSTR
jgi:hypothetical protein